MLSDLLFRLRAIFRAKSMDAGLDEELQFHLDRQLEKHIQAGLSPQEARRRIRLEFGGATQIREECRDARGAHALEALSQDLRYGFRTLGKNPGFTCVALITLALAIGANTAIFSVVYGALLRPLPYADPDRLIVLNETHPRIGAVSVSYPNFLDWRAQNQVFSGLAVMASVGYNLSGIAQPETIGGQAVSSNFLSLIGVHPLLGRDFDPSEDKPGAAPVVMLTHQLWQSHFAGRRDVIGRSVSLDGRGFTIIAVLPPDMRTTETVSVLEPLGVWLTHNSDAMGRGNRGDTAAIGRLGTGITLARARAEMEGIAARLAAAYPEDNNQFGIALQPIRELFVGNLRPAILVLFAAVMFVLLIACANVANLFLMRAAGRTREIALRVAVGATGGRIVQQMLAESFVVAGLGGVLGLGLAVAGMRAMSSLIDTAEMPGAGANLNGAVLLFALGIKSGLGVAASPEKASEWWDAAARQGWDQQQLDVRCFMHKPGEQTLACESLGNGVECPSDTEMSALRTLGVTGTLTPQGGVRTNRVGPKARAAIILDHPIMGEVVLKQPRHTGAIYVQGRTDWQLIPPNAPLLGREISLEPQPDKPQHTMVFIQDVDGSRTGGSCALWR